MGIGALFIFGYIVCLVNSCCDYCCCNNCCCCCCCCKKSECKIPCFIFTILLHIVAISFYIYILTQIPKLFKGLADGTYTLEESTVPSGYNKAADQTITIAKDDYTAANLEQTAEVINLSGSELPSTGGIGTTMFYVIGAILVIGAGVVLVTRRRMSVK